jgi:glyoxylase-like metal-dependent hydrolase (beta-lactamase superfamily II)
MHVELEAAPGIHRVTESFTNWYLVEDEGRLTVVDTGLPGSWDSLRGALQRAGRTHADIAAIVLTHGHSTISALPSAPAASWACRYTCTRTTFG